MKDVGICEKLRGVGTSFDPKMSEWGNPLYVSQYPLTEYIGLERRTWGTETSKYPQEKKSTEIPSVAASERGRAQHLYRVHVIGEGPGKVRHRG